MSNVRVEHVPELARGGAGSLVISSGGDVFFVVVTDLGCYLCSLTTGMSVEKFSTVKRMDEFIRADNQYEYLPSGSVVTVVQDERGSCDT